MIIYLILFLGMLNWMSFMSSRLLMSLYAIQLDASPAAIGVLIALYGLGPVLLSVQAGKISDRFGTYWPIVLGSGGLAVGFIIPWSLPGSLPVLYGSAVVIGVALVFINISIQNLVASLGKAEDRTRNVSLQSLAIALGALAGPLLVGLSIDYLGHVSTFYYLMLIVATSCVAWIACRRVIPHAGRAPKTAGTGGVVELMRQPSLRRIIIMSGLVVAGVDLYNFYMPLYGHALGLSATMIGVILGASAAASFVVRSVMPLLVRRWSEDRVLAASMILAGATFLLLPFVEQVSLLVLLSFALGLCLGAGQPLSVILTYNRAPAGRTGEALGTRFMVVNITHMAIPIAAGTVGAALGVATVFFANSALLLGGGYAYLRGTRKE
jgi:MFS family permease